MNRRARYEATEKAPQREEEGLYPGNNKNKRREEGSKRSEGRVL